MTGCGIGYLVRRDHIIQSFEEDYYAKSKSIIYYSMERII